MEKIVKLLDYTNREEVFVIKDFEKVTMLLFQIKSGDGILTAIYPNNIVCFDSSDERILDYDDGSWFLHPKDIEVINNMKSNYDTEKIDEVALPYEY